MPDFSLNPNPKAWGAELFYDVNGIYVAILSTLSPFDYQR